VQGCKKRAAGLSFDELAATWRINQASFAHVKFRPSQAVVEQPLATAGQHDLQIGFGEGKVVGDLLRDVWHADLLRGRVLQHR